MKTADKTLELIQALEKSHQFIQDERIVLTDEMIARELANREANDAAIAAEQQFSLDQMFPSRKQGKLYRETETTHIFDF